MSVDMKVKAIYDSEISNITRSEKNWKDVLKVAGQLYRYEFDNIVMVTAQRSPEKSTLMADYDTWKKVGRYVKRGAKGCAIFPSRALNPRMRYIFDISDTGGKNVKLTWDLEGENLKSYADFLVSEGQMERYKSDDRESLKNTLKQFTGTNVWNIIKEEFGDRMSELMQLSGSVIKEFNEKRKGLQQDSDMEQLVYSSVMYAVGTRCGFDLSVQEQDFSQIVNIKDEEIVYRLGSLVCDVSCSVLREFSRNLQTIESERRISYVRSNDLQGSGRTAVSGADNAGRDRGFNEAGQIRENGNEVSSGERTGKVQDTDEIREDVREDVGSRGGSKPALRSVGGTVSNEAQATESVIDNGDVEDKRAGEDAGRGSSAPPDRDEVSLETQEELNRELDEINSLGVSKEAEYTQASFFFDQNGQASFGVKQPEKTRHNEFMRQFEEDKKAALARKYNYLNPKKAESVPSEYVKEILMKGTGFVGGKGRVCEIYQTDSLIESMKEQHEQAVKSFEEYLEKIRPTMITKEGTACMDAIDKAWAEYKEVDAKVIEVGATTDTAKSLQAQQMMTDEAAPKYQALDDALQKLMALNISLGNAKRAQLRTVMIAALTIIIIVIAVSTIYSNSLSVAISKSIEKPLNELKDRFITFAEGDIDSPLPTVESEDEIKELVSGVSAMSDRIRVIIKDSGRMLNEMSEGNFAIDTECEEVYTGAFTDLLTGIRKMNEEIDTTVRGVDDASGQVLTGSTNLAEAAQSLAEGATDQAASVEEMQATINELTSGIKTTAEELGTAYDEAYKYAEIAEGSRGDMEVLVQAMSRINETSEKIGAIITQIEDIASQTNLLSLNASIEAARAGEAGKGFAVVADQIRNLAEQSAKSAVDSKALIEAAIHEVGDGNMYAEKASTSLREVVDGIQAIADSAKKIKEISIEQADSMEQVEATAERIAEVVQNNSAAAQETSATSEELTAQATTLSGMVSVFKLRQ